MMETVSYVITRLFPARRERVFKALTDPAIFGEWWHPYQCDTPKVEMDLQVGGKYRVTMSYPDKPLFYIIGEYKEIIPPERLVFTFLWDAYLKEEMANITTLITIELTDLGESTLMTFKQEDLPNTQERDSHTHGWKMALDLLDQELLRQVSPHST